MELLPLVQSLPFRGKWKRKTTLFNMLLTNERGMHYRKVVNWILRTNIIYFKTDKTILENVLEETNYTEAFVRTILARLLFRREDVHKPVHVLSGVNE